MTERENFRQLMKERKLFPVGSLEYQWRTRAARTYFWMIKRIPTTEWGA